MCGHPSRGWSRSSHLYVGSEYQLILLDLDHWVFCFSSPRQGLAVLCSPAPGPWVHYLPDFRFNLTVLLFGLVLMVLLGLGFWEHLPVHVETRDWSRCPPHCPPHVFWDKVSHWSQSSLIAARMVCSKFLSLLSQHLNYRHVWITGMQSVLVFMLTWKALGQ